MGQFFADIEGLEDVVELYATPKMVDMGIGPFECHGAKGFHHDERPVVEKILWDKKLYTKEENEIITLYVDDRFDYLCEELISNHDTEWDFPEDDD